MTCFEPSSALPCGLLRPPSRSALFKPLVPSRVRADAFARYHQSVSPLPIMVRCLTKPAAVVNAYSSARVRGDWRSARVSAPTATVSRSIRCHLRSEYLVTDCSSHRSLLRPCPRCLASAQLLRLPLPVSRPITNYSPSMFGRTVCSGQRRAVPASAVTPSASARRPCLPLSVSDSALITTRGDPASSPLGPASARVFAAAVGRLDRH